MINQYLVIEVKETSIVCVLILLELYKKMTMNSVHIDLMTPLWRFLLPSSLGTQPVTVETPSLNVSC